MKYSDIIKVFKYNSYVFDELHPEDVWETFNACYPDVPYNVFIFAAMAYYQEVISQAQLRLNYLTFLNQITK